MKKTHPTNKSKREKWRFYFYLYCYQSCASKQRLLSYRTQMNLKNYSSATQIAHWYFAAQFLWPMRRKIFLLSVKKGDTVSLFTYDYYQDDIPRYTLITKEDTKQLSYYAPEDLEKVCPPKDGRKHVIKIKELILKYFEKDSFYFRFNSALFNSGRFLSRGKSYRINARKLSLSLKLLVIK